MSVRIQVVLSKRERESFRLQAQREGKSLSGWLREAGQDKLSTNKPKPLTTHQEVRRFFRECDRREKGTEPDWQEHLSVLERSFRSGG